MHKHKNQKYQKDYNYPRHPLAHRTGGVHMNYEDDTKLLSVAGEMIKLIGGKIAKGDFNLATIPKPIILTHPLSTSECLATDFYYTDPYLNEAAASKDPLRKMQLVVTDMIASFHQSHVILKSLAPIDCVLGETVSRVKSDGTRYYSEFIKMDPPTTLYQVYGPNDEWMIYGVDEVEAQIHPTLTQIVGKNQRPRFLKFKDGKTYTIQQPTMIINGLLKGDRIVNKMDTATVRCEQDKLQAEIQFSYVYEGKISKMKNKLMFWSNTEKPVSDLVDIRIKKLINTDDDEDDAVFVLSQGSGSWLSHIEFDGEVVWRVNDDISGWQFSEDALESDSKNREDRIYMLNGQNDKAQLQNIFKIYNIRARNRIEEQNNRDIQTRKKYVKQ